MAKGETWCGQIADCQFLRDSSGIGTRETIRKPPGIVGCRRKPIVESPVSAFQNPQERGTEPLGRRRGETAPEPPGWKQMGVESLRPEGREGNSVSLDWRVDGRIFRKN